MSLICRALALTTIAVCLTTTAADEQKLEPADGVLVLRNGYVLQGRITPVNESFLVTMGSGGEVRLPQADVAFRCRNLDEAYLRKREELISDEPSAHMDLADWCLRHGLLARAADQLLAVFAAEPRHPRLSILEQRLHSLSTQQSASGAAKPLARASTPDEVPAVTRLAPQLMQQFTTIVQPILLNRCATYACHGSGGSTQYRLIRPSSGNATTSRMTHRNLQATLAYMDHERPENSTLLEQARLAHGGAKSHAFTEKQTQQLELLTAWVRRAAVTPADSISANRGGPRRPPNRPPAQLAEESAGAEIGTQSSTKPASGVVPAGYVENAPTSDLPAQGKEPVPRDALDPEVFNQRYHGGKKP